MFCSQCGKKVEDGAKFCSSCGYQLTSTTTNAPAVIKQVPLVIEGVEYDIVRMHLNNEFKNDNQMFDWIASKHHTSRKAIVEELEYQRYEILRSAFQLMGWVDKTDKTVICRIPVIEKLQRAPKGAKELEGIYKQVLSRIDGVNMSIKVFMKEYIVRLANEYQIKGTHDGPMMCPRCGGTNIEAHKKGFSSGKAVAGGLLLGPLGLAAGGMGSGKITCHCLNCGFSATGPGMFRVPGC